MFVPAGARTRRDDPGHGPRRLAKTSPPSHGTDPAKPQREHVVREGETLWSIAHRYRVTIAELRRWNHLDSDSIRPGEALRVGSQP